ncbi:DUF1405 domain-containing protein, partial [Staphylococcus capitis]|uniref:DUF1405 domain-containing protein n=1 Tax=Staphylococcus capitis TaxID=29388 RepID=UPI00370994C2
MKNSSTPSKSQNLPLTNTPTPILNQIIPPPSFSNHSPSTIHIHPLPKTFPFLIPHTPTPSLFLTLSIILIFFNKPSPILNPLPFLTLINYPLSPLIINILIFLHHPQLTINPIILILSHAIIP